MPRLRGLGPGLEDESAMRCSAPAYDRFGSFTSFPPSRRVRFTPRADIRPKPAFMSARPNSEYSRHIFLNTYVLCHTSACMKPSVIVWDLETTVFGWRSLWQR